MKKKHIIFHVLYYALIMIVYIAFFHTVSMVVDLAGGIDNFGFAIMATYGVVFVMTPILVAVLMRFSLFKWYFDPIAAAEIPLFLYVSLLFNQMKHTDSFLSAFRLLNNKLCDDGGMGWLFLIGLFAFGLVASLSFERKNGKSVSYRLLSRIDKSSRKDAAQG